MLKANWIVGVALPLLVAGCATAPAGAPVVSDTSALSTIQSRHQTELARLRPGMSSKQFLEVFPAAIIASQNGTVTAYEISEVQHYVSRGDMTAQNLIWGVGSPRARGLRQSLWFYFSNDKMIKWGNPQEWPSAAEVAAVPTSS